MVLIKYDNKNNPIIIFISDGKYKKIKLDLKKEYDKNIFTKIQQAKTDTYKNNILNYYFKNYDKNEQIEAYIPKFKKLNDNKFIKIQNLNLKKESLKEESKKINDQNEILKNTIPTTIEEEEEINESLKKNNERLTEIKNNILNIDNEINELNIKQAQNVNITNANNVNLNNIDNIIKQINNNIKSLNNNTLTDESLNTFKNELLEMFKKNKTFTNISKKLKNIKDLIEDNDPEELKETLTEIKETLLKNKEDSKNNLNDLSKNIEELKQDLNNINYNKLNEILENFKNIESSTNLNENNLTSFSNLEKTLKTMLNERFNEVIKNIYDQIIKIKSEADTIVNTSKNNDLIKDVLKFLDDYKNNNKINDDSEEGEKIKNLINDLNNKLNNLSPENKNTISETFEKLLKFNDDIKESHLKLNEAIKNANHFEQNKDYIKLLTENPNEFYKLALNNDFATYSGAKEINHNLKEEYEKFLKGVKYLKFAFNNANDLENYFNQTTFKSNDKYDSFDTLKRLFNYKSNPKELNENDYPLILFTQGPKRDILNPPQNYALKPEDIYKELKRVNFILEPINIRGGNKTRLDELLELKAKKGWNISLEQFKKELERMSENYGKQKEEYKPKVIKYKNKNEELNNNFKNDTELLNLDDIETPETSEEEVEEITQPIQIRRSKPTHRTGKGIEIKDDQIKIIIELLTDINKKLDNNLNYKNNDLNEFIKELL